MRDRRAMKSPGYDAFLRMPGSGRWSTWFALDRMGNSGVWGKRAIWDRRAMKSPGYKAFGGFQGRTVLVRPVGKGGAHGTGR